MFCLSLKLHNKSAVCAMILQLSKCRPDWNVEVLWAGRNNQLHRSRLSSVITMCEATSIFPFLHVAQHDHNVPLVVKVLFFLFFLDLQCKYCTLLCCTFSCKCGWSKITKVKQPWSFHLKQKQPQSAQEPKIWDLCYFFSFFFWKSLSQKILKK